MLPQGDENERSVRTANLISTRTSLLADLSFVIGQEVVVEQPDHKRGLINLDRWQGLCSKHIVYKSKTKQGAYSAETVKPTVLYSNHTKWAVLRNSLSTEDSKRLADRGKELVTKKRDASGRLRITGKPAALKSTQAYSKEFGHALVTAWTGECVTCWQYTGFTIIQNTDCRVVKGFPSWIQGFQGCFK